MLELVVGVIIALVLFGVIVTITILSIKISNLKDRLSRAIYIIGRLKEIKEELESDKIELSRQVHTISENFNDFLNRYKKVCQTSTEQSKKLDRIKNLLLEADIIKEKVEPTPVKALRTQKIIIEELEGVLL